MGSPAIVLTQKGTRRSRILLCSTRPNLDRHDAIKFPPIRVPFPAWVTCGSRSNAMRSNDHSHGFPRSRAPRAIAALLVGSSLVFFVTLTLLWISRPGLEYD